MKGKFIVFMIGVFLIAFKYYNVFDVNLLYIIGVFVLWFIMIYFSVHQKNKDRDTPRPVYLTNEWE